MQENHGGVLGIDASTQSMSAILMDSASGEILWDRSLVYRDDPRLLGLGFEHESMIIPPRERGEAEQPPRLFIVAFDALFSDLRAAGIDLSSIVAINTSGQQHGHVYLNGKAKDAFSSLQEPASGEYDLLSALADCFAYGGAPIWKTANTATEAAHIRAEVGGSANMIRLTGSDIPLRFSANIHRRLARRYPEAYGATRHILQISSLIPAILAGDCTIPIDFGNACGTGLMNSKARNWDDAVMQAVAGDLPGGSAVLAEKLSPINHPLSVCGTIAMYFQVKYGLSADCKIIVGSGDNPQSKVLAGGSLLRLGSSFVYMISSPNGEVDTAGVANAMYDGLGRAFNIWCRTNGALSWDRLRTWHSLGVRDYATCESALVDTLPGSLIRFWHPDAESFPAVSACSQPVRLDNSPITFANDYSAVVDSSLGLIYCYGQKITGESTRLDQEPLIVCGGPTISLGVMRRIAAIWNRPAMQAGQAGAALGAAVAAAVALVSETERDDLAEKLRRAIFIGKNIIKPDPDMVYAYHAPKGYLEQLECAFEKMRRGSPTIPDRHQCLRLRRNG